MTALMWAIKYRYLDIIEYLLVNGADPSISNDSGDNALIIALEHKLWDERDFIKIFASVIARNKSIINCTNRNNGNCLLHLAVKRDWDVFVNMLIKAKVQ